ncbi:MAG: alpha amylase N-terminal ig-like domain-containing protein [bacterium]
MRGSYFILILTLLPQLGSAINPGDITHNTSSIFYVNPSAGEVKLKIKRGAVKEAFVVMNDVRHIMKSTYSDANHEYYTATFAAFDTAAEYHFLLKDDIDSLILPANGEFTSRVPLFKPPNWAAGKTYYSIFVDGFYNADETNDPDKKRNWDKEPKNWEPYGGDLKGIIEKFAYIESLSPDIILLQPIFTASSNHKLNSNDFATIDPHFGDTIDIRNLINQVHAQNMKIILSVIFSHTGLDFPIFIDIETNGAASKYVDWYLINAPTIKKSPPNYECWRNDYRFPRLNLNNPQVMNYLIGYLGYWKRFGFDGFYIGEDENLNANFIRSLRIHMKTRYPDILLLGTDKRLLTGEAFDGSLNKGLTDLLVNYFVQQNIATSEFDRKLQQMLFFSPPQSNSVNLINLSTYDKRSEPTADIMKNLYAFIFTCIGSPVIMYGEEIAYPYHAPLNLGSFPWSVTEQNRTFLKEIKKLIEIRKTNSEIAGSKFFTLYVNDITKIYAYDRGGFIVVLNSGDKQAFISLPAWDGAYTDLINGEKLTAFSQSLRLSIIPKSYRILKREI